MVEERKVPEPPTGHLVLQLPKQSIGEIFDRHFDGESICTPRTFAAARRIQAKPGTIRVPRHLLRKLWELTGGWKGLETSFSGWHNSQSYRHQFPHRKMGPEYSGYFERPAPGQDKVKESERQKERVPWRTGAWGTKLGELEVLMVSTTNGPVGYLRWRGWVVGKIHYKSEYSQDQGWLTPARASEFRQLLCRPFTDEQADSWGFLTAAEVAKA